ncbi:hypothetical protein [Methylorubrum populi]|uniref:hypothetical protein n=1 Tax=Methylorubrum populi TaxID=223967 RepID=UPI003F658312
MTGTDSSDGISRIVRRSPTLPAREHVLCPNTIGARAAASFFESGLVGCFLPESPANPRAEAPARSAGARPDRLGDHRFVSSFGRHVDHVMDPQSSPDGQARRKGERDKWDSLAVL